MCQNKELWQPKHSYKEPKCGGIVLIYRGEVEQLTDRVDHEVFYDHVEKDGYKGWD